MLRLSFHQTKAEMMVRVASSLIFKSLIEHGEKVVKLSEISEKPQYGFTASAEQQNVGPKLVRITDLKDGSINWNSVPYCKCTEPEKYWLEPNDILFARTGATTGKTHLVQDAPNAIYASYLIRLRPSKDILAAYLYSFFQSDLYWGQILEEKEGSAQPNVNAKKLVNIQVLIVEPNIQDAVSMFLSAVRERQYDRLACLPELPSPVAEQRRVVTRIEELAAKVEEARELRSTAILELDAFQRSSKRQLFNLEANYRVVPLASVCTAIIDNLHSNPKYSDDGMACIRSSDVGWGTLNLSTARKTDEDEYVRRTRRGVPQINDIVFVREGGGTGKTALVETNEPFSLGQRVMMFRPDQGQILPKFFLHQFLSPFIQDEQIQPKCLGSASPHLNIGDLKRFNFLLPRISEQKEIVTYLDNLQTKINTLRTLQTQTATELDALLPAILDKAFKGEL
ncbi:MAG: restriction endonuclease subunit S [Cyanobacteria bacterium P01_D01_bin.44]